MNVNSGLIPSPAGVLVCGRQRWIADDFTAAARGRVPVIHTLGLDAVDPGPGWAWWTPAGHAARLVRAGVHLRLAATGPTWLAGLGPEFLQRAVWCGTLADVAAGHAPERGFAKVAEAKVDGLEAAWWDDMAGFVAAARTARVPDGSAIQISDRCLDIVAEHRCYIVDGTCLDATPYLDASGDTWEPGWDTDLRFRHADAAAFAALVARHAGPQPCAYVLDVAELADGSWAVIESNPAWCSGPYGADVNALWACTVSSSVDVDDAWLWEPDSYLVAEAERQRLLDHRLLQHPAA